MIGGVSNPADDPGLIAHLAANSASVQSQLNVALEQQSTGLVSDVYSGLGTGLRTSLDLRPAVQHQSVWQANIDAVSGQLETTQSVLSQINTIAQTFYAQTNDLEGSGTPQAGTIASSAKLALQQVAQLLNTKVGDTYIFAGQDTANPPLPSTDPAVVGPALLASDTATAPFSSTLGTAVPQVEVGDGQFVQAGLLANQNTLATSAAPTTGSYLRDVMRALATLTTVTDGPDNSAVAADTRDRLHSAIGAMADESGTLGNLQSELTSRQTLLASTQTTLNKQVSDAEDVDAAATLTRVTSLQTQLQASYQIIAQVRTLSLANYLSTTG